VIEVFFFGTVLHLEFESQLRWAYVSLASSHNYVGPMFARMPYKSVKNVNCAVVSPATHMFTATLDQSIQGPKSDVCSGPGYDTQG
jgi:hypothetical protein